MNKMKTLTVVIGVLIFVESAGLIFFAHKSQNLIQKNKVYFEKIENFQPGFEKMSRETQETLKKYEVVSKELEAAKIDRENLLVQAKSLLGERARAAELQTLLDKNKGEMEESGKESSELKSQNLTLNADIKKLKEAEATLTKERDDFKVRYEKSKKDTVVKELNNEIAELKSNLREENAKASKEKNRLMEDVKKEEKKNIRLTEENQKLLADKEKLEGHLNDYKKNYAEALKKNKALEAKAAVIPRKFAEIARQNKVLIRQTAEMHYNLGVFYTKNKDYDRALAEFEKCAEINPSDTYAYFNLGYIYSEYLVNRNKAVENFRHFLRLAKSDDPDVDWVKKYLLTWETFEGKVTMK
jgi:tetratricopeptide (TPR) repeat protein